MGALPVSTSISAVACLATPAVLAGGLAVALAFPEIEIRRADVTYEWPFVVDEGTLTCVDYGGQFTVIFSEPWREDVPQEIGNMTLPRSVIVSANPLALLASLEDRALYLPFDSIEILIRRLAPFEAMGRKLCVDAAAAPKTSH